MEFDQVTFAYEEGKPVLKDISIQAHPGQTLALVGHTGSGKSSIMNLLYRFYDPQEGESGSTARIFAISLERVFAPIWELSYRIPICSQGPLLAMWP